MFFEKAFWRVLSMRAPEDCGAARFSPSEKRRWHHIIRDAPLGSPSCRGFVCAAIASCCLPSCVTVARAAQIGSPQTNANRVVARPARWRKGSLTCRCGAPIAQVRYSPLLAIGFRS